MRPPARELEILLAVAHGKSLKRIARDLNIAEQTVRESLVKTRERYGAHNNEAAIATALDREDIDVPTIRGRVSLEADEIDLLERIAIGQDDKVMQAEIFLSRSPLDTRVGVILVKLGAVNLCQCVYIGYQHGLLMGYREHQARKARESEIRALSAMAQSKDLAEAARTLRLAPNTVKAYLERSRRRLNAATTPQAVAIAIRRKEIACPRTPLSTADALDARERRAMALVAAGFTDATIATRLKLNLRTANRVVPSAMRKLGAKSRSHAVYLLFQQGLLR
jgi:DNA-binding NarL/FixJ family response regulator